MWIAIYISTMFAMSWNLFIKVRMFWHQRWTERYRFDLSCQNVPFHHKIVTIYLPESETYFYRLFVTPPAHILLPCQTFSLPKKFIDFGISDIFTPTTSFNFRKFYDSGGRKYMTQLAHFVGPARLFHFKQVIAHLHCMLQGAFVFNWKRL